jgi:hypothetical protein
MAGCPQGDDRQVSLSSLEANVGPIEVKPQRWIEPQWCVAPYDQEQLVQGCHLSGQRWSLGQDPAAIMDPPNPFGGQPTPNEPLAPYSGRGCPQGG